VAAHVPHLWFVQAYREWDFSNMLTMLLRFNGRAVAAAVVRVFGSPAGGAAAGGDRV